MEVSAQDATPPAGDTGGPPPGIDFAALGFTQMPQLALPGLAVLERVTVAPGSGIPSDPSDPVLTFLYVECGTITITCDKPLSVTRAAALAASMANNTVPAGEAVSAGTAVDLNAGDSLRVPTIDGW